MRLTVRGAGLVLCGPAIGLCWWLVGRLRGADLRGDARGGGRLRGGRMCSLCVVETKRWGSRGMFWADARHTRRATFAVQGGFLLLSQVRQ
jgi:hypothetical protein